MSLNNRKLWIECFKQKVIDWVSSQTAACLIPAEALTWHLLLLLLRTLPNCVAQSVYPCYMLLLHLLHIASLNTLQCVVSPHTANCKLCTDTYLIFVISFTLAGFFYPDILHPKITKNTQKLQQMAPRSVKYAFFCIQSGKFYTGQNLFTQARPVVPVTNMWYALIQCATYVYPAAAYATDWFNKEKSTMCTVQSALYRS